MRIDQHHKLRKVFLYQLIRNGNYSVQILKCFIDDAHRTLQVRTDLPFALERRHFHLASLHHQLAQSFNSGVYLFRNLNFVFHPVNILIKAEPCHMLFVISIIVNGNKIVILVKTFYQHTLLIQVAKAHRPMDLLQALLAPPRDNSVE